MCRESLYTQLVPFIPTRTIHHTNATSPLETSAERWVVPLLIQCTDSSSKCFQFSSHLRRLILFSPITTILHSIYKISYAHLLYSSSSLLSFSPQIRIQSWIYICSMSVLQSCALRLGFIRRVVSRSQIHYYHLSPI